jgi:hypothetical protein
LKCHWEADMRIIDAVLVSFALGAAVGLPPSGHGSAGADSARRPVADAAAPAGEGSRFLNERLTWLRTPAMQRVAGSRQ